MEPMQVGKYSVVEKIGEGAMGVVYKAHDPTLHRYVAVKTMTQRHVADADYRQRFLREARSAAQLNHSNIVTIFDFGEDQGRIFMAMELLEGKDLKDLIREKNPLSLTEKLRLMEQICEGVGFAHAKGIVHRDLKPGNIHVQPNGQVKIMDFGLARLASSDITKSGVIMGTPNYMSPEQVQAQSVDARSDVFSLGAVFYELLCNRKPFDADSLHATLFKVVQGEREPMSKWNPNLPEPVVRIIDKALSKAPGARYQNAQELLQSLIEVRKRLGTAIEAEDIWSSDLQETMLEEPSLKADPSRAGQKSKSPKSPTDRRSTSRGTLRRPEVASRRFSWFAYGGGGFILLSIAGLALYFSSTSSQPNEEENPSVEEAVTPTTPSFQVELGRARESLATKDFEQVIAITENILATNPNHSEAKKISAEARDTLGQLEQSLEEARTLLASGQEEQAARKLAVALAIHPTHPLAVELSSTLDNHFRGQAESAERSMDQSRQEAIRAGAGSTTTFQKAENLLEQGQAQLGRREYTAATQKLLTAKDLFDRARIEKKQEVDESARAAAAARAGLQQAASQWERMLAETRPEDVQGQPAFQTALALEKEARRLRGQESYAEAVQTYKEATARLEEAQERVRQEQRAREAELAVANEPAPAATPPSSPPESAPEAVPTVEQERQAIRNVISSWERAIETQDIGLYRSIKPNLSHEDEQRLKASFEAVDSQHVEISILTIELQGNRASVRLARSDTIMVSGRQHSNSIEQTLALSKQPGGWVIETIGQ